MNAERGPQTNLSPQAAMTEEEFAQASMEHFHLLAATARSMGRTDIDAEDIAQEAMVNAFLKLRAGDYKEHGGLRGYLCTITRNLAISAHRKDTARRTSPLPENPDFALGEPPTRNIPEETVIQRERIAAALNCLSPAQRKVLILREQGYSHSEIGKILETTPNSSKVLLSKARKKIKKAQ